MLFLAVYVTNIIKITYVLLLIQESPRPFLILYKSTDALVRVLIFLFWLI
jgi:hypothetical protein